MHMLACSFSIFPEPTRTCFAGCQKRLHKCLSRTSGRFDTCPMFFGLLLTRLRKGFAIDNRQISIYRVPYDFRVKITQLAFLWSCASIYLAHECIAVETRFCACEYVAKPQNQDTFVYTTLQLHKVIDHWYDDVEHEGPVLHFLCQKLHSSVSCHIISVISVGHLGSAYFLVNYGVGKQTTSLVV